ncbi:MAG: Uma2 family endonuclease [Cyanosarcina radialis HA8281-LM2]|jgi:Uma2 family endonuclease|nr:Uma2 family endonuclease [Cyanosarcina radialis HA8281-LM2]
MYQTNPPRSPKEVLPTMYDLPSEDAEEPGLPDYFHLLQPRLLDETFYPLNYSSDRIFTASDLNLYYDPRHTLWYKRPDWFAVLGVSRLYEERDLRFSYVTWQEGVHPFIVVELLSPGTEKEDLGQTLREIEQPPTKWQVYEQILRIPYYVLFDRYTYELRAFKLSGSRYDAIPLTNSRFEIPELGLGLGVWQGSYQEIDQPWLRWCDARGNWIPTPTEREAYHTEQERQRAEQERQRADQEAQRAEQERQKTERLIAQLRSLGVEPDLD